MAIALSEVGREEQDDTLEDTINRLMEAKKLLPNASYFAFTATPKNKTLEIFGTPDPQPDGRVRHLPFHSYTMKQAIDEGFILDVLRYYTPVSSYYKLVKKVEGDPEFDTKRAKKKLRRYVESHDHAIRLKAEIMVDHFHEQVLALNKIGGEARAMVVTTGIERAIQYFHAIRDYVAQRKSRHKAIVAFSGEHEYGGAKVTEASLNGFASNLISDKIQEDPYRFLICADKFQTGYDEPLLHTMYVDKVLSGIKTRTHRWTSRARPRLSFAYTASSCRSFHTPTRPGEKLSIFLNFLVSKLPAPVETDLSKGILESIDMDSYRLEKQAVVQIQLPDADAQIEPVPTTGGGRLPEPELDRLSNILKVFNDQFGNIPWTDADRVHRLTEDIPNRVAADTAYRNAKKNSDKQNARIEHDKALARVMTAVLKDDTELFKQFMDNESFRRWLTDTVFGMTYEESSAR